MDRQKRIKKYLNFLKKRGTKLDACAAAKIPVSTVNYWLATYPDFREKYDDTLVDYLVNHRPEIHAIATKRFLGLLLGTATVQTITTKKEYAGDPYREELDDEGVPLPNIPIKTEITNNVKTIPTPEWVFNRILGNSDLMGAIATLINSDIYDEATADRLADIFEETTERAKELLAKQSS